MVKMLTCCGLMMFTGSGIICVTSLSLWSPDNSTDNMFKILTSCGLIMLNHMSRSLISSLQPLQCNRKLLQLIFQRFNSISEKLYDFKCSSQWNRVVIFLGHMLYPREHHPPSAINLTFSLEAVEHQASSVNQCSIC